MGLRIVVIVGYGRYDLRPAREYLLEFRYPKELSLYSGSCLWVTGILTLYQKIRFLKPGTPINVRRISDDTWQFSGTLCKDVISRQTILQRSVSVSRWYLKYSSRRLAAGLARYQVAVLILEICNCTCTYAVYIASVFEYINCTVTRILSL